MDNVKDKIWIKCYERLCKMMIKFPAEFFVSTFPQIPTGDTVEKLFKTSSHKISVWCLVGFEKLK